MRIIRLGRRIYDNVRNATSYVLAVHVPIAGMAIVPLLFGLPIVLIPIHIAFLEMVIDPMCSIVSEAEPAEPDVMRRPPRSPTAPLFSMWQIAWSVAQGSTAFVAAACVLAAGVALGMPEPALRAMAFVGLVSAIVGLIFVDRSFGQSIAVAIEQSNRFLWAVLALAATLLALKIGTASRRLLFRFAVVDAYASALAAATGPVVVASLEGAKWLLCGTLKP